MQHRPWPVGISKDSVLDGEVRRRAVGTWDLSLLAEAWPSVSPTREWALNGKGERNCWQGQEGHLGLLVTQPEVDSSGHNLGLLPVSNPLSQTDRWDPDSAPSHPSGQFDHWPQRCQQYPPSIGHPLG